MKSRITLLNFYTLSDYKDYVREFQKRYPKIKVNVVSARGAALSSRILTERRAGKYLVDVFRSGDISAYQVCSAKALQPRKAKSRRTRCEIPPPMILPT